MLCEEVTNSLTDFSWGWVLGALRKYHEKNNALPDRIVVYRDGVGDGQVDLSTLCSQ